MDFLYRLLGMLILSVPFVLIYALLELLLGWLLCRSGKLKVHCIGCRLWAQSGMFLKRLPGRCRLLCDGSCKNWTCPEFHR